MNNDRLSFDEYFMNMARLAAMRSTCSRLSVGAVFVNKRGHIISTGYNGPASGMPHEFHEHSTEECNAIHAEQNAIIQCQQPFDIHTVYLTHSPCKSCMFQLMNTSCKRIVYLEDYRVNNNLIWFKAGRDIQQFTGTLLDLGEL